MPMNNPRAYGAGGIGSFPSQAQGSPSLPAQAFGAMRPQMSQQPNAQAMANANPNASFLRPNDPSGMMGGQMQQPGFPSLPFGGMGGQMQRPGFPSNPFGNMQQPNMPPQGGFIQALLAQMRGMR